MEIRVYDNDFNFIGVLENHSSLLWHRTYNDGGDFTLTAPLTPENMEMLVLGRLVWVMGKPEAGVIESREMSVDQASQMVLTGRFLETYLSRRLVNVTEYTGRVESAMKGLVSAADLAPIVVDEDRGFEEEVTYQAFYLNMLDVQKNLAKGAALGFRMVPSFTERKITFQVYRGMDHRLGQHERTVVVFSDEYENLASIRRLENDQLYYNVCIVGGQGEDIYKTFVTVGDTDATGLDRREMYYEATDVKSNGMTWEGYLEALKTRGLEILEDHQKADSVECTVLPSGNFIYGVDYDIGDIVTVHKRDWNVDENLRITEVTEVYENELPSLEVVLGTPLPQTIKWDN